MNETIFYFFHNMAHQSEFVDRTAIFFADTFPYLVVIIAGLFLLFHHEILRADSVYKVVLEKKKEFFRLFITVFSAWLISYLSKIYFQSLRPFESLSPQFAGIEALLEETGYAFPSTHAAFFAALAFAIFFMHRKAGYVFMVFAFLIGVARIVAGVHFPIDILGGFVLGALVAYLTKKI